MKVSLFKRNNKLRLQKKEEEEPPCLKPVKFTNVKMVVTPGMNLKTMVQREAKELKKGANEDTKDGQKMIAKIDAAASAADQVLEILVNLEDVGLKVWTSVVEGKAHDQLEELREALNKKLEDDDLSGAAKEVLYDFLGEIS